MSQRRRRATAAAAHELPDDDRIIVDTVQRLMMTTADEPQLRAHPVVRALRLLHQNPDLARVSQLPPVERDAWICLTKACLRAAGHRPDGQSRPRVAHAVLRPKKRAG